ncbi:MAG: hypothetical protein M1828_004413 [Chrysothrix sp. TS-e1954]|nr:MAG: hypothetical protein M1828_004413 [Chrysothrix sp. TS-e1954]
MAEGFARLVPLILLLCFVGAFAWVGFQIYVYSNDLKARGQKSLEKRNISFDPKGGMRVGVKEVKNEDYSDRQQNYLVKAWNLSTWPEYRSRFWNKDAAQGGPAGQSSGLSPRLAAGSR